MEFGGIPASALTRALIVDQLAISEFIERELLRVLVKKFSREEQALREMLAELLMGAVRVTTEGSIQGVCRDPDDDRILETAVAAGARLLVAGDRDLLAMKAFQGIRIITPAAYLSQAF